MTDPDVVEQRFYEKFEAVTETGCWIWTGALNGGGYGSMTINSESVRAHRYSYELHIGPIPPQMFVCHSCDVRSCVNPDHLFLGTNQDNMQDCVNKGRISRGEDRHNAKLTPDLVGEIRERYLAGETQHFLAKEYNMCQSTISRVCAEKYWSHIQ